MRLNTWVYGYELKNLDLRRSGIDTSWERGNKICITDTERRVLKMDLGMERHMEI